MGLSPNKVNRQNIQILIHLEKKYFCSDIYLKILFRFYSLKIPLKISNNLIIIKEK
jgi:hypothetical protein